MMRMPLKMSRILINRAVMNGMIKCGLVMHPQSQWSQNAAKLSVSLAKFKQLPDNHRKILIVCPLQITCYQSRTTCGTNLNSIGGASKALEMPTAQVLTAYFQPKQAVWWLDVAQNHCEPKYDRFTDIRRVFLSWKSILSLNNKEYEIIF